MWESDPRSRTATPQHRAWRALVLTRAGGQCEIRGTGCTGTATEADHIIEVSDGGAELDPANGQAACHHCHGKKTAAHANNKRWSQRADKHPTEQHPGLR